MTNEVALIKYARAQGARVVATSHYWAVKGQRTGTYENVVSIGSHRVTVIAKPGTLRHTILQGRYEATPDPVKPWVLEVPSVHQEQCWREQVAVSLRPDWLEIATV